MIDTPVLIVGGGPVGMSLGLVLDRMGIEHLIVERNPSTTEHPKSRGCTVRTMENFRVWGIEDQVRSGGMPADSDVIWICESVAGRVIGVTNPEPATLDSPSSKCMVAQDVVEEALAEALLRNRHTTLRRPAELYGFDQDDDGVTAQVRDLSRGEETKIRAQYLVACDGATSRVRQAVGIEMEGPDTLALFANYYYRADIRHLPHARQIVAFMVRPTDPAIAPAAILATGIDASRWLYSEPIDEDQPLRIEEELATVVRQHWGIPDLRVELINVMTWRMSAQVAKAFRRGRVILAGDAAHRFPPAGGMGLNSGVQDAQNLGWKLAFVVAGLASGALLDTYEAERRQVAISNNKWSVGNVARLRVLDQTMKRRHENPKAWRDALVDLDNHLHSTGHAMGYIYEHGGFIVDNTAMPEHDHRYYWPSDRPGARFPHMWLDGARSASSVDWFDTSFVLVCGPEADRWQAAGQAVASSTNVPLVVRILPSMAGPFTFGSDGAVLVRPDGHVAWRPGRTAGDKAVALRWAMDRVLAGGTEARGGSIVPTTDIGG